MRRPVAGGQGQARSGIPGLVPDTTQAVAALTNYGQEPPTPSFQSPPRQTRTAPSTPHQQPAPGALQKSQSCDGFNDHRGCTLKQRDCPARNIHRCNMALGSGTLCGAWQHNRLNCPHAAAAATATALKPTSPGKGKQKGKKQGKGGKGAGR